MTLVPHLIWSHLLSYILPICHLILYVRCVISSSTIHLYKLYIWLHHNNSSSFGLHPSPLWWHYTSWHNLSACAHWVYLFPENLMCFLCEYSSSNMTPLLSTNNFCQSSKRAQDCQTLLSFYPLPIPPHLIYKSPIFSFWRKKTFSVISPTPAKELRSLKFILKTKTTRVLTGEWLWSALPFLRQYVV